MFGPGGPCYRCLYPEPTPAELAPSCDEAGVLGVLPGVVGLIQATEALKVLLGQGQTLAGRLLTYDALSMTFREFRVRRDPRCAVCGDTPTIRRPEDLEWSCHVKPAGGGAGLMAVRRPPAWAARRRGAPVPGLDRSRPSGTRRWCGCAYPDLPGRVELWGKCEWLNPGGSVKDRTALSLVLEGERAARCARASTIIDSSSGNTAVGLALVGRARGYDVELVMPANVSPARRRALRGLRREAGGDRSAARRRRRHHRVRELVAQAPERYFYADQYRSPANPLAHYRGTGPELWEQTEGRLTHFVAGLGTSGTVMGTGRFLRERDPRRPGGGGAARRRPPRPGGAEAHAQLPRARRSTTRPGHDELVLVKTEDGVAEALRALRDHGLLVGPLRRRRAVGGPPRGRRAGRGSCGGAPARRRRALPGGGGVKMPGEQAEAMLAHASRRLPLRGVRRAAWAAPPSAACSASCRVANREEESPARALRDRARGPAARAARGPRPGQEIVGFYHSHPDHPARPSETDRRIAAEGLSDGVIHVVVGRGRGDRGPPTAWVFRDAPPGLRRRSRCRHDPRHETSRRRRTWR